LNKYAVVFSAENQIKPGSADTSSGYEKMAIALAYSIHECMPNVDIYCASFTANKLSDLARHHFKRLGVHLIEDLVFPAIHTSSADKIDDVNNDYYMFNGFLRNFAKDYFAKHVLDQYDYLLYTDVDVLWMKEPVFNFDPTSNIALVEPTPDWCKRFLMHHVDDNLHQNLYLNWVDIINHHNKFVYDIDYTALHLDHASDVIISNRIDQSALIKIEQTFGGYGIEKPPTSDSAAHHYDSLGAHGTLYLLRDVQPSVYRKYMLMFDKILGVQVSNKEGYWNSVKDSNS
jgi:hypothetical protein